MAPARTSTGNAGCKNPLVPGNCREYKEALVRDEPRRAIQEKNRWLRFIPHSYRCRRCCSSFFRLSCSAWGGLEKTTSPYTRVGGDAYNRRRKRKLIADILIIAGGIVFLMALLSAFVPTGL